MKFISTDFNHRYLLKLSNSLDIKFTNDFKEIDESDRTFILWNPHGYLTYPQKKYIEKYEYYKKLKKENKPVYVVERGALPNSIFIDKYGFLCDSKSYNKKYWNNELTLQQKIDIKNYINDFVKDVSSLEPQQSSRLDKKSFFNNLNINPKNYKKIVFVPLQVSHDTVIMLWADWIKSLRHFQLLIAQLAKENPDILFLVKNHPVEKNNKMDEVTDNIKIIDNFHYKDAIDYSDIILTINSGIGLQAMMWKKPVIIVGKAFYYFKELNMKAKNKEDITNYLYYPLKPDVSMVYRFLYYLKFQFYTTCIMKKLSGNSSEPVKIDKITYEDIDGNRINYEKEASLDHQRVILFELLRLLPKSCITKETCLECLQSCELIHNKTELYIGTNFTTDIRNRLKGNNYKFISNDIAVKNGIKIHFEKMPSQTKIMTLWGEEVNVPFPVVMYLEKLYGLKWREKNKIKSILNAPVKDKLNIVYTFNNYGWIFEFEANYYKKFSSHNIIPIHQKELPNYLKKDIDMVVVPSAWHWVRDLQLNNRIFINEFKNKGVKFVCQVNSELEEKFNTPTADLIMGSSQRIYDILDEKYKYTKMIWFPHFVDTDLFNLPYQWNSFQLGFAGNIKNRFKRPHIIEKLGQDFDVLKKCDYHGFLNKNRDHTEMLDFYRNIDIYISPSLSEGSPMTMYEAMSCGKLVFITDTGMARYFLDNFFIIPNTTDEQIYQTFKDRLTKLKDFPISKLEEIGKNNRKRILQLDWKNNVQYLDAIYTNVYNNKLNDTKMIAKNFTKRLVK